MSQQSSLTQSAHSVRQVLTAYSGLLDRQPFGLRAPEDLNAEAWIELHGPGRDIVGVTELVRM
jgi:hypothetical protein